MRLALDARNVYRPNRRGTGKNLIDMYRRIAELRPHWQIYMFYQLGSKDDPFEGFSNVSKKKIDIPGDRFNFWEDVRLPLASFFARADLLHCPANTAPRYCLTPYVITIHDLNWFDPRFKRPQTDRYVRNLIHGVFNSRRIITPSEYTKARVVERFNISPDKITVNYWAADSNCGYIEDKSLIEEVKGRYGIKGSEYILAFGAVDPRKNTARLIYAWNMLPKDIKDYYRLLIIGLQDEGRARYTELVESCGLEGSVFLAGYAAEEDLPALLSGATCLCYPSLSEGFGLPILDAFSCNCPVVASGVTAIPEIGRDACFYIDDPESIDSIAYSLRAVIADKKLQNDLRMKGKDRLKDFSWDKTAKRAIEVFEEAVG